MNDKQRIVDRLLDNEIKIYDLELIRDTIYEDGIEDRYEYNKEWQGKVNYQRYEYMFLLKHFKTECNGSTTAVISSNQKPKDMTEEEWDNIIDYLQEYIEKDYRENWEDWTGIE